MKKREILYGESFQAEKFVINSNGDIGGYTLFHFLTSFKKSRFKVFSFEKKKLE